MSCKDEFELFNGECIQYAFIATYNISNSNDLIRIFNPERNNDLYAMKFNNNLSSPNPEVILDSSNNTIYFYLEEDNHISLSYLFENIYELVDFAFNDKYINNISITDMKGMFSGFNSLINIFFFPFKGKDLIDFQIVVP